MIKIITMVQAALVTGLLAISVLFVSCSSEVNEEQAAPPQSSNKLPVDAMVVEAVDFNQQEVCLSHFFGIKIIDEVYNKE